MVLLLQQWFVRQLIKRMMQLMTSEAFTEHRTKIPSSYLENYLAYQAHFSLSRLINKYYSGLANKWSAHINVDGIAIYTPHLVHMHMYLYNFGILNSLHYICGCVLFFLPLQQGTQLSNLQNAVLHTLLSTDTSTTSPVPESSV